MSRSLARALGSAVLTFATVALAVGAGACAAPTAPDRVAPRASDAALSLPPGSAGAGSAITRSSVPSGTPSAAATPDSARKRSGGYINPDV